MIEQEGSQAHPVTPCCAVWRLPGPDGIIFEALSAAGSGFTRVLADQCHQYTEAGQVPLIQGLGSPGAPQTPAGIRMRGCRALHGASRHAPRQP